MIFIAGGSQNTKNAFKENNFVKSSILNNLYGIKYNNEIISIGIEIEMTGNWVYGKLFEDINSKQCFALVVNGYLHLDA